MSRKKKSLANIIKPHNSGFMRLKNQLRKKHSSGIDKANFIRPGVKNKMLHIPYVPRHPKLAELCGVYKIVQGVPDEWVKEFNDVMKTFDNTHWIGQLADCMMRITPEEFKDGTLGNKKFNRLQKDVPPLKNISKPKLINILEAVHAHGIPDCCDSAIHIIKNYRMKSMDSIVHISCDPWDIARMGVGYREFRSCMDILKGTHTRHLLPNLQDPGMAICFLEEPGYENKVNGLRARAIVRLLHHNNEVGIFLDRLYGDTSCRIAMEKAMEQAANKVGIKLYWLQNYKHSSGSQNLRSAQSNHKINVVSELHKFRIDVPYNDQTTDAGYVRVYSKNKNIYCFKHFKVVLDEAP